MAIWPYHRMHVAQMRRKDAVADREGVGGAIHNESGVALG